MGSKYSFIRLTIGRLYTLWGRGLHTEAPPVRAKAQSLFLRHVDGGSSNICEQELVALESPIYDLPAYGIHFVASPRHADLLVVTGPLTWNMLDPLSAAFAVMPDPKRIVAIGPFLGVPIGDAGDNLLAAGRPTGAGRPKTTATSDLVAVFEDSYATLPLPPLLADTCVAVLADDPPTPQALLQALLELGDPT